jgi:hypothetical protein
MLVPVLAYVAWWTGTNGARYLRLAGLAVVRIKRPVLGFITASFATEESEVQQMNRVGQAVQYMYTENK